MPARDLGRELGEQPAERHSGRHWHRWHQEPELVGVAQGDAIE